MEAFEKKLKTLKTQSPSHALQERIFAQPSTSVMSSPMGWWSRPVRFGWSFAMAVLMGLIGYAAGTMQIQLLDSAEPDQTYEVYFVENNQSANLFSVNTHDGDFLSGQVSASVEITEGI